MMNPAQAKQLLDKYEQGTASADEVKLIENWYAAISREQNLDATEADFWQMKALIWADTLKNTGLDEEPKIKVQRLWPRIAVAAAAVAAIVFGIWFYNTSYMNGRHPELVSGSQFKNDIAPGKNTATLILANGKTITLSDAKTGVVVNANEMKYNDGSVIDSSLRGVTTKQSHEEMLTAATPRGGTYQFTLPDGTHVWLNAASTLKFPSQFSGEKRKILLSGEAYFEVAKVTQLSPSGRDGRRPERVPFIVQSEGQQVEVLGTHFNINAYTDEGNTKTTLLEGSVKVSALQTLSPFGRDAAGREGSVILTPNQQSNISSNGIVSVKQIDPTVAIDWKNGQFIFDSEPLPSILRKVSRWYNVTIIYANTDKNTTTFSGVVSRTDNVSSVLRMLQKTSKIKFTIDGNTVKVE